MNLYLGKSYRARGSRGRRRWRGPGDKGTTTGRTASGKSSHRCRRRGRCEDGRAEGGESCRARRHAAPQPPTCLGRTEELNPTHPPPVHLTPAHAPRPQLLRHGCGSRVGDPQPWVRLWRAGSPPLPVGCREAGPPPRGHLRWRRQQAVTARPGAARSPPPSALPPLQAPQASQGARQSPPCPPGWAPWAPPWPCGDSSPRLRAARCRACGSAGRPRWPPGCCGGAQGPSPCSTSPGSAGCTSCAVGRAGQGRGAGKGGPERGGGRRGSRSGGAGWRHPWAQVCKGRRALLSDTGHDGRATVVCHAREEQSFLLLSSPITLYTMSLNIFVSAVIISHQRSTSNSELRIHVEPTPSERGWTLCHE